MTRQEREQRIREQHADWTDEQVKAEADRQEAAEPPPEPKPDDRAFAEMRRRAEQAERDAQALREAEAERQRKEAEEQGEWQKLAEQRQAEIDRLKAEGEAEKAERNAERSAADLKFRDTGYALYKLRQDRVDLNDPAAVKTALEDLAKASPDMVAGGTPPPSGGPAGGSDPAPPKLTAAQIAEMSPAQIAKLDPKVVNEALAAG